MAYFITAYSLFIKYFGMFMSGVKVTLYMAAITVFFGTIFGTLLCLIRSVKFKPVQWLSVAYIEIIRGTPLLLQMYIVFFFLPNILGFDIPKLTSAIVALVVNSSAYVSELIRSGIQAVDKGQAEAARSLGLTPTLTMTEIVLPQAVRNILPALGNEFISIIKESSLGATFFVGEIMTQRALLTGALYLTLEPLIVSAVLYFALTFTLSKIIALFERRMAVSD